MTGDTRNILSCMRAMAWARAQGELNSMLETFFSYSDTGNELASTEKFLALQHAIKEFVTLVDNNGLVG